MGNLRRYMPFTFVTFAVGWLAIAGVPPLSGFWAKGDVLENACRPLPGAVGDRHRDRRAHRVLHEPPHRAGVLRPRPVVGRGAYRRGPGPARRPSRRGAIPEPHESPWVMRSRSSSWPSSPRRRDPGPAPASTPHLSNWIAPVFGGTLYNDHLSAGTCGRSALVDGAAAVVGVFIGLADRGCGGPTSRSSSPPSCGGSGTQRLYDAVIGRPCRAAGRRSAPRWSTPNVIDGAVNGIAAAGRTATGRASAALQTGYVRNYALGIAFGPALVLAFMLSRLWWA